MSRYAHELATDIDRDHYQRAVTRAHSHGTLTTDQMIRRVQQIGSAATLGELEEQIVDLPRPDIPLPLYEYGQPSRSAESDEQPQSASSATSADEPIGSGASIGQPARIGEPAAATFPDSTAAEEPPRRGRRGALAFIALVAVGVPAWLMFTRNDDADPAPGAGANVPGSTQSTTSSATTTSVEETDTPSATTIPAATGFGPDRTTELWELLTEAGIERVHTFTMHEDNAGVIVPVEGRDDAQDQVSISDGEVTRSPNGQIPTAWFDDPFFLLSDIDPAVVAQVAADSPARLESAGAVSHLIIDKEVESASARDGDVIIRVYVSGDDYDKGSGSVAWQTDGSLHKVYHG